MIEIEVELDVDVIAAEAVSNVVRTCLLLYIDSIMRKRYCLHIPFGLLVWQENIAQQIEQIMEIENLEEACCYIQLQTV